MRLKQVNTVKTKYIIAVAACVSSLNTLAYAQSTIPALLSREGTPLTRGVSTPSGLPPSISQVLAVTDTVVRGIVGKGSSHLTADQEYVVTDYPIESTNVLYSRDVTTSPVPGAQIPFVVRVLGGTVAIGGLTFTEVRNALPELVTGTDCLLFLRRVDDHYEIAATYYGAFSIINNGVTPLVRKEGFALEYRNGALESVVSDALARLKKR